MEKLYKYIGRFALGLAISVGSFNSHAEDRKNLEVLPDGVYQTRFNEFKEHFDNYSRDNPYELTDTEFKSLLVSIAQRESSLGHPNGGKKNPFMLMGFGNPKDSRNYGIENQLGLSSKCLRDAFNEKNKNYTSSFDKEEDDKIRAILSIYNQGSINSEGMAYARGVYSDYIKWNNYFKDKR